MQASRSILNVFVLGIAMDRIYHESIYSFYYLFILTASGKIYPQTCRDVSVELTATVQTSPPQITLQWVPVSGATSCQILRKLKTDVSWGNVLANLPSNATQYIDANVSIGISYEYRIVRVVSGAIGNGYINAGIAIPVVESRGILILVVDSTFIDGCSTENNQTSERPGRWRLEGDKA